KHPERNSPKKIDAARTTPVPGQACVCDPRPRVSLDDATGRIMQAAWDCEVCTFRNAGSAWSCAMCDEARPVGALPPPQPKPRQQQQATPMVEKRPEAPRNQRSELGTRVFNACSAEDADSLSFAVATCLQFHEPFVDSDFRPSFLTAD